MLPLQLDNDRVVCVVSEKGRGLLYIKDGMDPHMCE